jgi:hypothetical protein
MQIVNKVLFIEGYNEITGYSRTHIYGVVSEEGAPLLERHHIGSYDPDVMFYDSDDFVGKTLSAARAAFSAKIREELEFLGCDEEFD